MHPIQLPQSSYMNKSLDQVYALHEKEKKNYYLDRVIQIEKVRCRACSNLLTGGFITIRHKVRDFTAKLLGETYVMMLQSNLC